MSGTNEFTGDLNITSGKLTMSGTLNDNVDVINSGIYDVDATDTIASLNGSGSVELAASATLTVGVDNGDDTISGGISGGGNLTKAGNGELILSGVNAFTGDLSVADGTVFLSGGGSLADSASVLVSSGPFLT